MSKELSARVGGKCCCFLLLYNWYNPKNFIWMAVFCFHLDVHVSWHMCSNTSVATTLSESSCRSFRPITRWISSILSLMLDIHSSFHTSSTLMVMEKQSIILKASLLVYQYLSCNAEPNLVHSNLLQSLNRLSTVQEVPG